MLSTSWEMPGWMSYKLESRWAGETSTASHKQTIPLLTAESEEELPLQRSLLMRVKAAAAAKSLQLCPTLCDPIDGSPPGSPFCGILLARTLEWVAISFSNAWKWKWSRSVVSNSLQPHGLQPTRLLHPGDFPDKSTRVGCHCLLGRVKEENEKAGLKLNIKKTKIMASSPITSWQIEGERWK